jgi:DNA repair protein RecO (recombination protein O)
MRCQLQPAYLLHRRPYRDGSDLLDVFSAEQGRLGLVARGLNRRRRGGSLAALLQPFRPLLLSFSGRGELLALTAAEPAGDLAPLSGRALFSAFYLNELLLRLLQRFEAHPELFVAYAEALGELAEARGESDGLEPALRRFEFRLLEELGYAVDLTREAFTNAPVAADAVYALVPESGLRRARPDSVGADRLFRGAELLAIAGGDFDPSCARAAKRLVRILLHPHLGPAPLRSRAMFSGASSGETEVERS